MRINSRGGTINGIPHVFWISSRHAIQQKSSCEVEIVNQQKRGFLEIHLYM